MADGDVNDSRIPWELLYPPSITIELGEYPEIVPRNHISLAQRPVPDKGNTLIEYTILPGLGDGYGFAYGLPLQRQDNTPGQVDFLKEVKGVEAPLDVCLTAPDIAAYIASPHAFEFYNYSDRQLGLIAVTEELAEFSITGSILVDATVASDALICDYFDLETAGSYDADWNIININTGFLRFSEPDGAGGFSSGISDEDALIRLSIAFEEYAHAYQVTNMPAGIIDPSFDIEEYAAIDQMLWALAEEAQAKLLIAHDMVTQAMAGNRELYLSTISTDSSGIGAIAQTIMSRVQQDGLSALSSEETLYMGFMTFFNDPDAMVAYHHPEYYEGITHSERIPVETFTRAFGRMLNQNEEHNFLEGRVESLQDVIDVMPVGSPMREWFDQNAPVPQFDLDAPYLPVND